MGRKRIEIFTCSKCGIKDSHLCTTGIDDVDAKRLNYKRMKWETGPDAKAYYIQCNVCNYTSRLYPTRRAAILAFTRKSKK